MASKINPLPDLSADNYVIGDTVEVVTKQNSINAKIDNLALQINETVDGINTDVDTVTTAAASLNVAQIVYTPGSGQPNEAGNVYTYDVGSEAGQVPRNSDLGALSKEDSLDNVEVTTSTGTQTVAEALDRRGVVFDSVADMQAAVNLTVGTKVRTLGYYTPGDGGGNDYEIVVAGTGTDDGGSFIDLSGSGLQAKGLFDGLIYVAQFGAVPTSGQDETARIQNAIDYVASTGFVGGGDLYVSAGFHRITKIILKPNVSIICEGEPTTDRSVTWDHRGNEVAFVSEETIGRVRLLLGEITHSGNNNTFATVDFIWFKAGLTASEVKVTCSKNECSNNGVILYGKHPDTGVANNNAYRNNFTVVYSRAGGAPMTESPGVGLWLNGTDTPNTKCNSNNVLQGSKFDRVATPIKCHGNGNGFYNITVNGPASNGLFHFYGNGTFMNTIYGPYNDRGALGGFALLENTASIRRDMAIVINPVNAIDHNDINEVAGSTPGSITVLQGSNSTEEYPGYSRLTYLTANSTRSTYPSAIDTSAIGNMTIGASRDFGEMRALEVKQNLSGGVNQFTVFADSVFSSETTTSGTAYEARLNFADAPSAYTTQFAYGYRATVLSPGLNQTISAYQAFTAENTDSADSVRGFVSKINKGQGKYNFYASGLAPSWFHGGLEVGPSNATWNSGSGSPEGVVTAPVGSMWTRTDGGAGTTLYVKESGTGNTGWVAK